MEVRAEDNPYTREEELHVFPFMENFDLPLFTNLNQNVDKCNSSKKNSKKKI